MGNCCSSSKRSNGYDSTDDKILEESLDINKGHNHHGGGHLNNNNNNHHHHHHHHHVKRNSNGGLYNNEMKSISSDNHHNNSNSNKRNSLKSSSQHKLLVDEDKEDLISASVHQKDPYDLSASSTLTNHSSTNTLVSSGIQTTTNTSSSTSSIDNLLEAQATNTTPANHITSSQSHSFPQKSTGSHSYPHTHTRQMSTEKVGPQFKTPITSIPYHMRMEGFQRAKHNSTSSLYIKSTLSTPDNDEILRCMANALLYHIERGAQLPQKTVEIFSEEKYPITKNKIDLKSNPTVETIYKFIRDIFKAEKLDSECAIMCLAYIERIITYTGITLSSINWRRIVLSALILASKVWEDQSVWNVDFLPVFDNLTAADLNCLERQFLAMLQYNVSLNASIYAKYYFELRNFSKLDSNQFPLKPLDKSGVRRLEDHSKASEYRVKPFKRSASVDQINPPEIHTRAVIN
ncbi:hypothetical protein RB653_003252 [Dictyostelium firmibasis]|uniref:Cyclin-like domain-containing protein n=1 Tax=Dictyostelium firmibasis TaxID=79012 RepID=A0AAN7YQQ9_9MYCE